MSSDYVLQASVKVGQHLINITGSDTEAFRANLQWTTENAAGIVAAAVALEAANQVGPLAQNTASVQVQTAATAGLPAGRSRTTAAVPAAAARTGRCTRAILCAWADAPQGRWHIQGWQPLQRLLLVHGAA